MRGSLRSVPRLHRLVFVVALLAMVLYYVVPPPLFDSKAQGDGWFGFHYLPALVLHGSLNMRTVTPKGAPAFDALPQDKLANRNPVGPYIAMLPVYMLLLGAEAVIRKLAPHAGFLPKTPFDVSNFQVFWAGMLTLLAGLCGMALTYRLLWRRLGPSAALWGSLSALFATSLFWYCTVQPHYQHGLTFCAVALFVDRWDRDRGSAAPGRFLLLGVLGGLAMLMRTQEFVFLLAPGCEGLAAFLLALSRRQLALAARWAGNMLLLAGGAVLAFAPQLAAWTYYFGFLKRPVTVEIMRPLAPALVEVLFSTRCGLFPWTPVVYLAVLGAALWLWRRPAGLAGQAGQPGGTGLAALIWPLFVVFLADLYVCAAAWAWYGAYGFGCRRLSDCAPIFAVGVGLLIRWTQVRAGRPGDPVGRPLLNKVLRIAAVSAVIFCLAFNLLLTDILRRRALPSSGNEARPAYRSAEAAGAPAWLVRLLHYGYPFVQPAGWIFAAWHHVPVTTFEGVVGNYALEREAHDLNYIFGNTWDFTDPHAQYYVVEGLLPVDSSTAKHGRPVARHVRMLLQPFGHEPIRAGLVGEFPTAGLQIHWNGVLLPWTVVREEVQFLIPEALVQPHHVGELTFDIAAPSAAPPPAPEVLAAPPRISALRLRSFTVWWKPPEPPPPALRLPIGPAPQRK